MTLSLSVLDVQKQPFHYAVLDSVLEMPAAEVVLHWLEREESWKLAKTEFYEQYEFCIADVELPATLGFLKQRVFLDGIRGFMEDLFGVSLDHDIALVAHKLIPSQYIGIHNDYRKGTEDYRLTLQLSRTDDESAGGFFMLFNSGDATDVHRILRPANNSALAFAISKHSFHAVSRQHWGTRFTLVFSFYEHA